ncbi:MAG: ATP-binding protein [Acidobacteriota bacterium]|nr:ATP-binding protein [Acidobacteriota bacterium]
MQFRQKLVLLGAGALSLPLIELVLSALGIAGRYRLAFALVGVGAIVFAGLRLYRRTLNDLRTIRTAIDETASNRPVSTIEVCGPDEVGLLADAVRVLRERLTVMNQLLIKSSRIESLNILGSILAHDMKNFSFRLSCLGQNAQVNYDDPEFRESLIRALRDTTQEMDQMVRRFREQKDTVIVKLRIDLNKVVRNTLNNIRRDAPDIRITEQYDKLPSLWADALLVENAVYNIVANACDAMPWGGHLAVRTQLMQNDGAAPQQVLVEIADSGIGMAEEFVQNELFAPFVTTKEQGLGLGLYTCQQIIRMHGGKIRVYSELGRGTVFSIYLPVTD